MDTPVTDDTGDGEGNGARYTPASSPGAPEAGQDDGSKFEWNVNMEPSPVDGPADIPQAQLGAPAPGRPLQHDTGAMDRASASFNSQVPRGVPRPYANGGAATMGNQGRNGAFDSGLAGDPGSTATASGQDAGESLSGAQFNSQVPPGYSQHSVLQQAQPSANGMSAADYQRMLPGMTKPMPSANGTSSDTYEQALLMRLRGLDSE